MQPLDAVLNQLGDGYTFVLTRLYERLDDGFVRFSGRVPDQAAELLAMHERLIIVLGYRRALDEPDSVDVLEATLVTEALSNWLPRLGDAGARVRDRMLKRGLTAVSHHLIAELGKGKVATPIYAGAGAYREHAMEMDELVSKSAASPSGVVRIRDGWSHLRGPLAEDLPPAIRVALFLSFFRGLGGASEDAMKTAPYTPVETTKMGAFDLLAAYGHLIGR